MNMNPPHMKGFFFFPKTRCRRKACSTRMRDFEPDPMILDVRPGYSLSHSLSLSLSPSVCVSHMEVESHL